MRKKKTFSCFNCGTDFAGSAANAKYCSKCGVIVSLGGIASTHNFRARRLGADGTLTGKELLDVYHGQGQRCLNCGSAKVYFDHVVPLGFGGTNTLDNIQLLCPRCNRQKCQKTIDYRKQRKKEQHDAQPSE